MAELVSSPGKSGTSRLGRMPIRVDLTAMVDLAFLLITFFILTTTLQKNRLMPLVMPDKSGDITGSVPESRTMTICLGKSGQAVYYLGLADKPLTMPKIAVINNDLNKAILNTAKQVMASTGKSLIVLVKPSVHSLYKSLVSTIDALNITQTESYAIVDIAPQDVAMLRQKGIF